MKGYSEIKLERGAAGKSEDDRLSVVGAFTLDRPAKKVTTLPFIIVHKKPGT